MPKLVILDTDILIDFGHKDASAKARLEKEEKLAELAISIVTKMELIVGCRNKKELKDMDVFLKRFKIVSIDEDIADKAAELLIQFRLSHGLLIADSLIAATALTLNVSLLSKNQKDFRFIKELDLLPYS